MVNRFFYTQALRLFKPLLMAYFKYRARKAGGDWEVNNPERFGRYPSDPPPLQRPCWVHAASLGETRAAQSLVRALLAQNIPVLITHMTPTGRTLSSQVFADEIAQGTVVQAWLPFDYPQAAKGFFDYWKPRCGLLIEREIWPNIIACATQRHIPMILTSARFSESSRRRNAYLGSVMREAYSNLTLALVQTHEDAERLLTLGVKNNLEVVGNLKFDLQIAHHQVSEGQQLKEQLHRPVIALASIRDGEELLFIREMRRYREVHNPPLFLLIPRHPELYEECTRLLIEYEVPYVVRSKNPSLEQLQQAQVMLGDTVGEMYFYYALSDVAIMGGSFLPFGGQNHIEPVSVGVPVIVGPSTYNFSQSTNDAVLQGVCRRVENITEALDEAMLLLDNPEMLRHMSQAGKAWLALHEGATRRIMRAIDVYLR